MSGARLLRLLHAALLSALLPAATTAATAAAVSVVDDSGHRITLAAPATRIVSLAPHATELLFAAGAGARVVGVSAYSNFPAEASRLPSVGDAMRADLERIIALKPDLIVGWKSGNNPAQLERLRALGLPVFDSEPRRFDDIASALERLGTLAGSDEGRIAAARFRDALQQLRERYAARTPVTVFYQIWPSPLMTLNDAHIVSEAIRLCGGINLFGALAPLVPTVSREAVLKANPQAIFVSDEDARARAGPRMLTATARLCEQIDAARQKNTTNPRRTR